MEQTENQLAMLKVDLGLRTTTYEQDGYLCGLLNAAIQRLTRDGITLAPDDAEHDQLVVMYAAWLYRKRGADPDKTAMPQMLRTLHNNVLFGQKMAEAAE